MNRPSLQLACLVFVVAMALRCDANRTPLAPDLGEPQTAAIQGAVLSGGSPLTGAEVALVGPGVTRKVISGTGGAFAFADLRPGLYTVTASFADFGCSSATAVVKAGETATMGIDCTAAKPQTRATITGSVTAGDAPVGGAEVTLKGFGEVHAVVADTVGRFTFSELASGPYEVWAAAPGFSCESMTLDIQAAQTATVNISCAVDDGGGGGPPVPPMDGPGKIAFERAGRIMVVDPEGRNALTFIEGLAPSWSEDGTKLAFQRPGCPDRTVPPIAPCDDIWMVNANGSGLSPITDYEWVLDSDPVWSPDGSKVAFVRFVHGPDQSYLVVADVDPPTPLWSEAVPSGWWPLSRPTWSPDGARIAFTCEGSPPGWESDICVVASDRNVGYSGSSSNFSGLAKITADNWTDSDPAWSPDGARIAFSTNRDATGGRTYIALINPDGSGFTRLVAGRLPAWSPDGTRIVFVGGADAPGLHVVNADGSGLARITNDPADTAPSWGR